MTSRRGTLSARREALRTRLLERDLGALLVTHLPNIAYLTDLHASAGAAVVSSGELRLIVDSRYHTTAQTLAEAAGGTRDLSVVRVQTSYDEQIVRVLTDLDVRRVGFESNHVTVRQWSWLTRQLEGTGRTLVEAEGLVETGRIVKDQEEVERFRTAGALLAGAVGAILDAVRPDRTEREVAADIELRLTEVGFDDRAFPTIVASGSNSALPHARPSRRRLAPGDLVLLDFGGVYDGYCVDLSRTVCIGQPTPMAARLHRAVLEAQAAAIETVRPGVAASAIDAAARETLARHGLAEAFGHSTGHGLGLEIHEAPRIGRPGEPGVDTTVTGGMVFTVEPGVYVPGVGGVRIEDDVVVTDDGCQVLTDAPRGLAISPP